jgi:hypothetical protein
VSDGACQLATCAQTIKQTKQTKQNKTATTKRNNCRRKQYHI